MLFYCFLLEAVISVFCRKQKTLRFLGNENEFSLLSKACVFISRSFLFNKRIAKTTTYPPFSQKLKELSLLL